MFPKTLVLSIALAAGCGGEPVADLHRVVGVWTTSTPKYADRHIELTEDGRLLFGRGELGTEECAIQSVDLGAEATGTVYRVSYQDSQGLDSLLVFEHKVGPDVICLVSQPKVTWTRKGRAP